MDHQGARLIPRQRRCIQVDRDYELLRYAKVGNPGQYDLAYIQPIVTKKVNSKNQEPNSKPTSLLEFGPWNLVLPEAIPGLAAKVFQSSGSRGPIDGIVGDHAAPSFRAQQWLVARLVARKNPDIHSRF